MGERAGELSMTPELVNVLVADDDRDIRDLVSFKLGQAGFRLRVFDDGTSHKLRCRTALLLNCSRPQHARHPLIEPVEAIADVADSGDPCSWSKHINALRRQFGEMNAVEHTAVRDVGAGGAVAESVSASACEPVEEAIRVVGR